MLYRELQSVWAPGRSQAPLHLAMRRRCHRHTSTRAAGPADSAAAGLPAGLAERMARLRALEDYADLLRQSDVLAAASAAPTNTSSPAQPPVDLIQATILIARHARPHLDAAACVAELERLAADAEARISALDSGRRYPLRLVKELNAVLYGGENPYQGNEVDYYSPDNSYIDRVLEQRRGIPISLSLVYMAVAARVGLTMEPVNLPAHLMLRPVLHKRGGSAGRLTGGSSSSVSGDSSSGGSGRGAASAGGQQQLESRGDDPDSSSSSSSSSPSDSNKEGQQGSGEEQQQEEDEEEGGPGLLVDAFHGGELCWLQDAEERLSGITGMKVVLDPRWATGGAPAMSGGAFLLRWLNNLRQVFVLANRAEDALAMLRYMRATLEAMTSQAANRTPGAGPAIPSALGPLNELTRDEGLCLYALGRWPEASEALSGYLKAAPTAPDAGMVTALLQKIRDLQRRAGAGADSTGGEGEDGGSGGSSGGGAAG